jgi:hypothetical protein
MHGGHDPVIVERIEANESISVSGFAVANRRRIAAVRDQRCAGRLD